MSEDLPSGQGTLFMSNGDVFDGIFEQGRRADGPARLTYSTGEVYEGNFRNDVPDG